MRPDHRTTRPMFLGALLAAFVSAGPRGGRRIAESRRRRVPAARRAGPPVGEALEMLGQPLRPRPKAGSKRPSPRLTSGRSRRRLTLSA